MFIPSKEVAESVVRKFGSPVFLTDRETLEGQVKKMQSAFGATTKLFYAVKANFNPHIVQVLKDAGVYGVDAVSLNEIRLALELGFPPERVLYTPSNPSNEELHIAGEWGVLQNLGSLSEIRRYGDMYPGTDISIRVCPEVGAGEFEQVTTGHLESKFGVPLNEIPEATAIAEKHGLSVVGIHCHIGSGFYESSKFKKAIEAVANVAKGFPRATFIDLGGGFGVPYRPEQKEVDLTELANAAQDALRSFAIDTGRELELYLEPGKFLVSGSTVLLTRVTTVKEKGGRTFVGVDTGFNHLIRPAMYGAYHTIVNVSRLEGERRQVTVAGNLCETGDVLNNDIELVSPEEGDTLAILVAGGYGTSMSSNYNMRELAAEVLLDRGHPLLTKKRQSYADIVDLYTPYWD